MTPASKALPRFLVVWAGQLVSAIGSGLTGFALGVHVYRRTGSATAFALLTLCAFLPSILLRPVGGVWADRFDRRAMMVAGDLGSAAGLAVILAFLLHGPAPLGVIYGGVLLSSAFVALQNPAYKASVTDLVPEADYARCSGLVQLAASAQFLLSPVLAGLLLQVASVTAILALDILSFLAAVAAVLAVRKGVPGARRDREPGGFLREFQEGWAALVDHRGVLALVLILSLVTFYIGLLQALLGPMVLAFADARTLGAVISCSATGMLAGSLVISLRGTSSRQSQVLAWALGAAGICFGFLGLTTRVPLLIGAGFCFFLALPFVNTSADVLIRRAIGGDTQGRAWGIIGLVSQLGYVGAYLVAGVLADRVFNPWLREGGRLAATAGRLVGTGPGRGIGLMLLISGLGVAAVAACAGRLRSIRALEGG